MVSATAQPAARRRTSPRRRERRWYRIDGPRGPVLKLTTEQRLTQRLLSRKFWMAVVGAAVFIYLKQYPEAASVIIAYIAVQGLSDAFGYGNNYFPATPMIEAPSAGDPEMEG